MSNLVALSQTVCQRVNDLVAPPSWAEVIYVIPLYGVSRGLNLNLSSMGGRITTEPRQGATFETELRLRQKLWGRAEAEAVRSRPRQDHVRPSQLKNCLEAASSQGRCLEDYIPDYINYSIDRWSWWNLNKITFLEQEVSFGLQSGILDHRISRFFITWLVCSPVWLYCNFFIWNPFKGLSHSYQFLYLQIYEVPNV